MTAIVGILNSRAFAIAADSAVTVSGNNGKKVYNRGNKVFTLSKIHPVGIAIYSSVDFLGIPLETIIKLYRQKLKETFFGTIAEYQQDFLDFLKSLVGGVSTELKRDNFYGFCGQIYHPIIKSLLDEAKVLNVDGLQPAEIEATYDRLLSDSIVAQRTYIDGLDKSNYVTKTLPEYTAFHADQLLEIVNFIQNRIREVNPTYIIKQASIDALYELFHQMINVEWIFESLNGLVFFGFGDNEIYPATSQALVGATVCDIPRISILGESKINPGVLNSNIQPYAQSDVTNTVLTGVDPNYISEMETSIKRSFNDVSIAVGPHVAPAHVPAIGALINNIGEELIKKLNQFQFDTITGPLLDILTHMGKEDMAELAESLVNITSLKRKFTLSDSSDESVGGPVDVAVVTKGDGFIWIKRKHYFNMENNTGFSEKYLKF